MFNVPVIFFYKEHTVVFSKTKQTENEARYGGMPLIPSIGKAGQQEYSQKKKKKKLLHHGSLFALIYPQISMFTCYAAPPPPQRQSHYVDQPGLQLYDWLPLLKVLGLVMYTKQTCWRPSRCYL